MNALALSDAPAHKLSPAVAYRDIVHPVLTASGYVPRGALTDAEGTSQDMRAGIDWIVSGRDGTQTSVGSRVQWDHDYGTFTVRYRTEAGDLSELTKRYRSVVSGGTYPTLTVQAYVERASGILLNAYVVRTEDLYRHIITMTDDEHFITCRCVSSYKVAPGGARFMLVAVTEEGRVRAAVKGTLLGCGVPVAMVRAGTVGPGFGL